MSASLLLGASVAFISWVDVMSQSISQLVGFNTVGVAFCLMVIGYFGVRFSGQGVMTSAAEICCCSGLSAREAWYPERGAWLSLWVFTYPLALAVMIDTWEWRAALWWLAVVVGPVFALLCLLLVRDSPKSCGLLADNQAPSTEVEAEKVASRNFNLKEAAGTWFLVVFFGPIDSCVIWYCGDLPYRRHLR